MREKVGIVVAAVVFALACGAAVNAQSSAGDARQDEAARAALKEQARETTRAFFERDFETLLDSTHPKVFEAAGGRESLLATLRAEAAEDRAEELKVVAYEAGEPGRIVEAGTKLFAVVPTELKLDMPKMASTHKSYLLAVSDDGGKVWKFIDGGGLDKDTLKTLVPEAVGVVTLPEPVAPVFRDKP